MVGKRYSLEHDHMTLFAIGLLVVVLDRWRLDRKSGRKWRETETGQSVLLKPNRETLLRAFLIISKSNH